MDNKINNRELRHRVRSRLLDQIGELTGENQKYRHFKEEHEEYRKIIDVIQKHGIRTWHNVPEALDAALTRSYPTELDTIFNQLQVAIKEIDKLKAKTQMEVSS